MRNDIIELFTDIDDDLIAGAMPEAQRPIEMKADTRRFSWGKFAAAAACLAVVIVGGAFALKAVSGRGGLVSSENANSGNPDSDLNPGGSTISDYVGADYPEEAKYQYTGDFSELELCCYAEVDRMAYFSFGELVDNSDLIVMGTFVDNARQNCPTENKGNLTFDATHGASYNKLRIDRVFYGDIEVGEEIVIRDSTYVTDGKMMYIGSSTLTPMIKGEQWVYFLRKQLPEYGDYYHPLFTEGRYPVPGNENTFVLTGSQHGVFEERYFHEDIYADVKKMLGYVDGVEVVGEYPTGEDKKSFTMPEFPGDTFTWTEKDITVSRKGTQYSTTPYTIHGVISLYLTDINDDGKRELIGLCLDDWSETAAGFIRVYDYANKKIYPYRPAAERSYNLKMVNNELYVVTQTIGDYKDVSSEPLTVFLEKNPLVTNKPEFEDNTSTGESNQIEIISEYYAANKEFTMPEFPEDKFILREKDISVSRGGETASALYSAPGIMKLYLADLNSDGKRELISVCWEDLPGEDLSGYITVYDYANSVLYPPLRPETMRSYDIGIRDNELCLVTQTNVSYSDLFYEPLTLDMFKSDTGSNSGNVEKIANWNLTETKEFTMPEFSGDKFIWKKEEMSVSHGGETASALYTAPRIVSVYLTDLNGDGKRELVNLCWNGASGRSANQLLVYDYANSKLYTLKTDNTTLINNDLAIRNNVLYVVTQKFGDYKAISSEPLTLDMLEPITRCGLDNVD